MAKRGPQKTPTALLRKRGSWRAVVREKEQNPCLVSESPDCPSCLKGNARREWTRLVKELDKIGLLAKTDRAILVMHCQAWSDWLLIQKEVNDHGYIITKNNGDKDISPAGKLIDIIFMRLLKSARELGLTPSARGGMSIGTKSGKNSKEKDKPQFNIA